jgi:hypothetical protein
MMREIRELLARRLLRDVYFLRKAGKECFPSRSKDALLSYLGGVHMTYSSLRRRKWAGGAGRLIAALYDLPDRRRHPIRAIIDATASPDADPKAKSRATRALRFAWRRRKEWGTVEVTLNEFIRQNGGVSGCAAKFAQARRSHP